MSPNRRIALMGMLASLGVTAGYLLAGLPNVELISLVLFTAGFLLGARDGAVTGGASGLLYTVLNPYGPAHPAVSAAQVAGFAIIGAAGALARPGVIWSRGPLPAAALLGLLGALFTALYDLLTNAAFGWIIGQVRATVLLGIPFLVIHVVSNAAIFAVVGSSLLSVLRRRPLEAI
jgi:hypothetical protein